MARSTAAGTRTGELRPTRTRPALEGLEARALMAASPATALETQFLERLNDVRAHASGFAPGSPATRPLTFSPQAKAALESIPLPSFSHQPDADAYKRALRKNKASFQENNSIVYEYENIHFDETGNMESSDIEELAEKLGGYERRNRAYAAHRAIGIALTPFTLATGDPSYPNYQILFARVVTFSPTSPKPTLSGTVYHDDNENGAYDVGEGVAGATVSIPGRSVQTSETGSYLLTAPRARKAIVTVSGAGFADVQQTVSLRPSANTRSSFRVAGQNLPARNLAATFTVNVVGPVSVGSYPLFSPSSGLDNDRAYAVRLASDLLAEAKLVFNPDGTFAFQPDAENPRFFATGRYTRKGNTLSFSGSYTAPPGSATAEFTVRGTLSLPLLAGGQTSAHMTLSDHYEGPASGLSYTYTAGSDVLVS